MEIPQGAKFLFVVLPLILVVSVLIFVYLGKDRENQPSDRDSIAENSEVKEVSTVADFEELEIETTKEGEGSEAKDGDTLVVHYEGTLRNGNKFDSSYDRGVPFEFILGMGSVIRGWEEGLKGMKVGEERIIRIPSEMGYGASGAGTTIPANAGLIFRVTLLEIK